MKHSVFKWVGVTMILLSLGGMFHYEQKEIMRINQYQNLANDSKTTVIAKTDYTFNKLIKELIKTNEMNSGQQTEIPIIENSLISEKELLPLQGESNKEITKQFSYDWNHLLSINNDLKGWITIPDSLIDFPVVQTGDNDYYLSHDFSQIASKAGCPFFDKSTESSDQNRIIYGHNMGTGSKSMFSTLLYYEDPEYFNSHPFIYLTELYGNTTAYEVISVIKLNVHDIDTWDFRIRNFDSKDIYESWYDQMHQRATYIKETADTLHYPAKLLTLSTCDRREWGADGRLLIIGRAV